MADPVIDGNDADVALPPGGVEGNARLTGATGATLFVLLAAEGITILRIHDLITAHVFIGIAIAAFVATKLGSVAYRFRAITSATLHTCERAHRIPSSGWTGRSSCSPRSRCLAPVSRVSQLATPSRWLIDLHKASFILWFVAMTVHVLGHILDTPALAIADYRSTPGAELVSGTWLRRLATVATLVTGIVLAVVVINSGWMTTWTHFVA